MSLEIRRATADDIPHLLGLMREFYAESDYPLDTAWAAAVFKALLSDERRGAAWIAFLGGEPVGHAVMTVRFSMEYGGLDAWIDDLFVQPEHRRRGVGRALLEAFEVECASRAVLAIHVEVGHDNGPALALYDRHGLRDTKRRLLARALGDPLRPI